MGTPLAKAWKVSAPGLPRSVANAFPYFEDPEDAGPFISRATTRRSTAPPTNVPSHLDWRERGIKPFPRSQGNQNACTSFAIVAVVEALSYLRSGRRLALAPGYIHTCLMRRGANQGVSPMEALEEVAVRGIALRTSNDYPFPETSCGSATTFPVNAFNWLDSQESAMAALASGPLVGDMWMDPTTFLTMGVGDIYHLNDSDNRRLHSVAVVGYDLPSAYWIVANSFGPAWCDGGFARVAFGSGGLMAERGAWQIVL